MEGPEVYRLIFVRLLLEVLMAALEVLLVVLALDPANQHDGNYRPRCRSPCPCFVSSHDGSKHLCDQCLQLCPCHSHPHTP